MRTSLFVFLLTLSVAANAQDGIFAYGAYGSVGYAFNGHPKLYRLENLRQSYNDYFASNLLQPMEPLRLNNAFQWSAGLFFNVLDLDVAYSKWRGETFSVAHSGIRREWQMDMFSRSMQFGITLPLPFLRVGGYIGFDYHKGTFYSRMVYPDGYVSYGMESRLNGIYNTASMDYTGGFKVMAGYMFGFIYFKADYVGLISTGKSGAEAGRYRDNLGNGFNNFQNYTFAALYPMDIEGFNDYNRYAIGMGEKVDSRIKGWRFFLGATFCLCAYDF